MKALKALSTSVGSKFLVALTGLLLVGFLIAHLAESTYLVVRRRSITMAMPDQQPAGRSGGTGLIGLLLLHLAGLQHVMRGRTARPESYTTQVWAGGPSRKSLGSTTMVISGIILLVFLISHIATLKYGPSYHLRARCRGRHADLYRLVVEVFQSPWVVIFYVVSMAVVGLHLRHGISSAFQSLGLMTPGWTPTILWMGLGFAVILAVAFALIPVWVFAFL
jgi:succinate dehydrogenase / fumarate reductase cytochrome b subunit